MSESRIGARWAKLRQEQRRGLVVYLTAGYPDRTKSLEALRMVQEEGADFVELGLAFSDPLADGPVIQAASHDALEAGMDIDAAFELARRAELEVPVIAFSYLNPILAYGPERFIEEAVDAGVAGVLITDLPAGEAPELEELFAASPLDRIQLIAPTTQADRVRFISDRAEGFLYLIARLGVTGAETEVGSDLEAFVSRVRSQVSLPVVVGFGIRTAAQASRMAELADGIVVGSALVSALGESMKAARDLVRNLRRSLDSLTPV